jgi:hypothetical protein
MERKERYGLAKSARNNKIFASPAKPWHSLRSFCINFTAWKAILLPTFLHRSAV